MVIVFSMNISTNSVYTASAYIHTEYNLQFGYCITVACIQSEYNLKQFGYCIIVACIQSEYKLQFGY